MADDDAPPIPTTPPADDASSPVDPASASLSRALNLSFALLKLLMLAVVVLFAFSCLRSVQENEIGLVRRFGDIVTDEHGAVRKFTAGRPYFIWPEPVEQLELVRTGTDAITLTTEFWPAKRAGTAPDTNPDVPESKSELDPTVDGYCLTGDFNIVHTRWRVEFTIDPEHPEDYINAVALGTEHNTPEKRREARLELLRQAARAAIFKVVSGTPMDDLIGLTDAQGAVMRVTQRVREEIRRTLRDPDPSRPHRWRGGFVVNNVYLPIVQAPGQVIAEFDASRKAAQQANQRVNDARDREAVEIRNKAATQANKIVQDATVYQQEVVAVAEAEAQRVRSFLSRFPDDPVGLENAMRQHRYDRVARVLEKAVLVKAPRAPAGAPHVLTLTSPSEASAKDADKK